MFCIRSMKQTVNVKKQNLDQTKNGQNVLMCTGNPSWLVSYFHFSKGRGGSRELITQGH